MNCTICNEEKETRFGACFDCAEAETIIKDGLDMYDKDFNGVEHTTNLKDNSITAIDKLKFLIKKGWRFHELQNEKIN